MKLASLKQKYSDMPAPSKGSDNDEYYPTLYLDEKQIDAMGIETSKVGTEMTMTATIRVSSVSDSKNGNRSMSFEIIEAGIESKEKAPEAANVLFPNG